MRLVIYLISCRLEGTGFDSWLGRDNFSPTPKDSDLLWRPASPLFQFSPPEVKWQKREPNHPLPSSAYVKSGWSYTSVSSIHFIGVDRKKFTIAKGLVKVKGHPCTGTEALYGPYGP